jgi:hypothetical protein
MGLHQFDDATHYYRSDDSPYTNFSRVKASMASQVFKPNDQAKSSIHAGMHQFVETWYFT